MTNHKVVDEDFIEAVRTSVSIREVLGKLGMAPFGGNYASFRKRVKELGLDTSHFLGQGYLKGKSHTYISAIPLIEVLVVDRPTNSDRLRKRLIRENIFPNECVKCGNTGAWCNEELVLHLDHINGDHIDNRLENLRLLCPNCHSQTSTYCSKNKGIDANTQGSKILKPSQRRQPTMKLQSKPVITCAECGAPLSRKGTKVCGPCYQANQRKYQIDWDRDKISWPSLEELETLLKDNSYVAVGKLLGVSDNAVRKRVKKLKS